MGGAVGLISAIAPIVGAFMGGPEMPEMPAPQYLPPPPPPPPPNYQNAPELPPVQQAKSMEPEGALDAEAVRLRDVRRRQAARTGQNGYSDTDSTLSTKSLLGE